MVDRDDGSVLEAGRLDSGFEIRQELGRRANLYWHVGSEAGGGGRFAGAYLRHGRDFQSNLGMSPRQARDGRFRAPIAYRYGVDRRNVFGARAQGARMTLRIADPKAGAREEFRQMSSAYQTIAVGERCGVRPCLPRRGACAGGGPGRRGESVIEKAKSGLVAPKDPTKPELELTIQDFVPVTEWPGPKTSAKAPCASTPSTLAVRGKSRSLARRAPRASETGARQPIMIERWAEACAYLARAV